MNTIVVAVLLVVVIAMLKRDITIFVIDTRWFRVKWEKQIRKNRKHEKRKRKHKST